ncbi:MAG: 3-oxoacyl-[acyl-carrier-protein] reductase [Planctomycetota bacterium]
MTLTGKVALVTGASRGIGRAVAVELARQGAEVFCTSTKAGGCDATLEAIAALENDVAAHALVCDVSDAASVDGLAKSVLDDKGALHVLVNNAGITRDGVFMRMSDADFDDVLSTNLRGAFLVCRAFARTMAKARGGRIVNIGSVVGLSGNAGQVNYAASKAGLVGMTKSLAQELAGRGVTANVIAPGFIETDMTAAIPEAHREAMQKQIPLARFGAPQDIAAATAFLASDAGGYITGQTLVVDGGMTM